MTEETNLDFLIDVENDIEIDLDNIKVPEKKKEITIDEYLIIWQNKKKNEYFYLITHFKRKYYDYYR